ncbi:MULTISPECIES: hypothetical protein [unclassified Mesorhizobium]|uniref:hypothetical protein n=1 Tax=unclassified Mesorhizobium TaxID=325217 RepID=UPI00112CF7F0|nr:MULTISPECIES: hypothetical protein [unclassified Mesorhizobium]TPK59067.1 hypothetical protein FJ551_26005 [Mesorhizobium sp. B2-5-1]TPL06652.1 hypothetical protein FJ944_22740 [Mesorhizobium sp. B2-4-11]
MSNAEKTRLEEVVRGNFVAVTTDEPQINNWHTAIYEDDYKGLLIALCNQNGRYPWQATAILAGLNGKSDAADLLAALKKAEQFIVNGVELGFIRMPEASTPDPAHDTLSAIRAAISKATGAAMTSNTRALEAEGLEPVGYASDYGLEQLAKRAHHYCLAVHKEAEKEFTNPLYLASSRAEPTVKAGVQVKALEWGEIRHVPDTAWSESMLRQRIGHHNLGPFAGSYSIQEMEPGGAWGWWNTWTAERYPDGVEPTEDAAKAAAQADYEARILSALATPSLPVGDDLEGLVERAVAEVDVLERYGYAISEDIRPAIAALRARAETAEAQSSKLRAKLEEARKALKPFATAASQVAPDTPDLKDTHGWTFQAIDFRRAARSLSEESTNG